MTRPVDWAPLAGSDPVPGDPGEVARLGRHYRSVAEAIEKAAGNLRRLADSGDAIESKAVDAFDDKCEEVAEDISRAHERYAGVGDALLGYAPALEQAQADSLRALLDAQAAQEDQHAAQRRGEHAATPEEILAAERATSDASAASSRARTLLEGAIADRDRAAQRAADAIDEVRDSGDLNDGWWDNWGCKVISAIQKIASTISMVCGILALAVGWIPIIGQALAGVLGTIALITAAVSLLCNAVLVAAGDQHWSALVWDAIAVASFGVGRVVGTAARASTNATRGAVRLGAGQVAARGGGQLSMRGLGLPGSLAGTRAAAARGLQSTGQRASTLSRGNVWASVRSMPADFAGDLRVLGSAGNWPAAGAGLGPAFRGIFTGGGMPALYGQTALVESRQLVRGLDPRVLAHPIAAPAISYTNLTTTVAIGAQAVGNLNDLRELGVNVFGAGDGGLDLNLDIDPVVP
ncbi:MAG: putative T7SS-secreted protein [Nocardioides sp.]